jgi:hypothetical protein
MPDYRRGVIMKFAAGLCLMLLLGTTAASAESPSPFKMGNLFKPYDDARVRLLQTSDEWPTPTLAREMRLVEFTLKREGDRARQVQLTIGTPFTPSTTRVGDVRGQPLVTIHLSFRTLPLP